MTSVRPWRELPALVRESRFSLGLGLGLAAVLLVVWTLRVFPEWSNNADLSHGMFTPLLFALLIHESRQRGPCRLLPPNRWLWISTGASLSASVFVLFVACLYASAFGWTNTVVEFLLGFATLAGLVALWLVCASKPVRLLPFNWIAAIALGLWVLSLPIPPGTYQKLTLSLQLWVSENVLQSLHLLGIPAYKEGNIIRLAHTSVGVEEACSGVRSLISCIYAGFFFSASFVSAWGSRFALIVLAAPIAIAMNFARSLTLTLLTYKGIEIEGTWHDATGFAILGFTALILGGIAFGLDKFESRHGGSRDLDPKPNPAAISEDAAAASGGGRILATGFGACLVVALVFALATRPAEATEVDAPDLLAYLPESPSDWELVRSQDLYRFSSILETENLAQRTYLKRDEAGNVTQITFYLAYWLPGQSAVSSVATHTPDACWPGAGWEPQSEERPRVSLPFRGRELAPGEYRVFNNESISQHVWFWHSHNRQVLQSFDPRRPLEVLGMVLAYGVRSDGEQLFLRMSSNRPWEEIANEPLLGEVFSRVAQFGI